MTTANKNATPINRLKKKIWQKKNINKEVAATQEALIMQHIAQHLAKYMGNAVVRGISVGEI